MVIKKVRLNNYQSHSDSLVTFTERIAFVVGLDRDHGTSNGSGKSSIINGIIYGIYGKSNLPATQLVRHGCGDMLVAVEIEHLNKKIQIVRSKSGTTGKLSVFIDGQEITGKIEEKQAVIDSLFGDYQTFVGFSVVDSVRFLDLEDLSSSELRDTLLMLVNAEKIQKMQDDFGKRKMELEIMLKKNTSLHFPSAKRMDILKSSLILTETEGKALDSEIGILTEELGSLSTKKENLYKEIENYEKTDQFLTEHSKCPTCFTGLEPDKKTVIAQGLKESIMSKSHDLENIELTIKTTSAAKTGLSTHRLSVITKTAKIRLLIGKLDDAVRNRTKDNKLCAELGLYTRGLQTINKFLSFILTNTACELEDYINGELSKFTDMVCKINLTKTTNEGKVIPTCSILIYRDGNVQTYKSLSSGEKSMLALLLKLGINSLKGTNGLFLVDEGLDRLDQINRSRILNTLELSNFSQIMLISHREELDSLRNTQRIYVIKNQGISTISGI
jgi:DNA repair exonuclease SbcCD ATPase subunit